MEWVSIKDKLPPNIDEEYITTDGIIVTTFDWTIYGWHSDVCDKYLKKGKITHWMPLPEPPKQLKPEQ